MGSIPSYTDYLIELSWKPNEVMHSRLPFEPKLSPVLVLI